MKQTIKFLRGASTYASYDAAITALNGITHVVGQPVVAIYQKTVGDATVNRLILGVGKAAATGASSYEILATDADLQELVELVGQHIETKAGADVYGHAKSSTQISFTNGEASINKNQVALDRLAQIAKGHVLGVAEDGTSGNADVVALDAAALRHIIDVENTYKNIVVGGTTIAANGVNDTLEFVGGTNIDLTAVASPTEGANKSVTVNFNGTDAALLGTPTTPTVALGSENANRTNVASTGYVKNYVDDALVVAQAMQFKGTVAAASDLPDHTDDPLPVAGWTYRASAAFQLTTAAGTENVEVGDMIICSTSATDSTDPVWSVVQNNIDGAVTGPASSVNGNIAVFDGATGKVIKDSTKNINNVVFDDRTVTATNGLELDSSNSTGALSSNVIIKHSTASPTIGNNSVVTGVTVDTYGHVATVTTTDFTTNEVDENGNAFTPEAGKVYCVSGAEFDATTKTQLNVEFTELPGKVRVSSADAEANFLENKVVSGTENFTGTNNVYGVTVTKQTDASNVQSLALTCTIDVIDGGTF